MKRPDNLPKIVNPERLAAHQETFQGSLLLADMSRLVSSLHQPEAETVEIELKFAKDQQNLVFIHGKIRASLPLLCQRCFEPMHYPLNTEFNLSPVLTEAEADNLPAHYEPLLVINESVNVMEMVEEELLLCLPLVPKHTVAECPVKLSVANEYEEEPKEKKNPFEVLKNFKKS